jgi:hypothetical protein
MNHTSERRNLPMKKTRISDTRVTVSRRSIRAGPGIVRGLGLLLVLLLTAVPVLAASYDLSTAWSSATINGAIFLQWFDEDGAGTGNFDSFLRIQANDTERGYNTDGALEFDSKGGTWTHALLLSEVPTVSVGGTDYREFQLDIDETASSALLSLDELQLFTASSDDLTGYAAGPPPSIGGATTLVYNLDADEDNTVTLNYLLNKGSGWADYLVLVPDSWFGAGSNCEYGGTDCTTYVYLYSRFGDTHAADDGFEEWAVGEVGPVFQPGTIIVEKQTDPDGAPDSFTFGGDAAGTISDGGQIVVADLTPGTYTSQETVPSGWDLTSIVCDDDNSGGDVNTGTATFQLEGGETVTCVFTNTRQPGTIIVEKQTDPDGAPDSFTFSGDAAGTISDGGQIVVGSLTPGTYTSQETVPSGWDLTSIVCDDDNSSGDVNTGTATFQLEAGETVKCTFTNTRQPGTIIVEKQTDPDGAPDSFTFSGDAAGTISDGGQIVVGNLTPGTYTSQETVPSGWDLTSIVCDDDNSSGDVNTATATFQLEAGETVKCTFTNEAKPGRITIWKDADHEDYTNFEFTGDLGDFILDDAVDPDPYSDHKEFFPLDAGDYTVTEIVPAGWELDNVVCTGGDYDSIANGVTIHLDPGEEVNCTFYDKAKPGKITIVKEADPDDGTDFDFTGDLGDFILDDADPDDGDAYGDHKEFSPLDADDYDVTEILPTDWELDFVQCDGGAYDSIANGVTIHLKWGEDIVCTFYNKWEPTAITLASFTAEAGANGVTLAWETGTEMDNAGFNLYRALTRDGPYTQINDALIAAQGDPVSGASYSFADALGYGTFYYKLEDVDYYGVSTLHGPVKVTVARPLRRPLYRPTLPEF